MQILQWLFKVSHEEQARELTPSPANKGTILTAQEVDSKNLVLFKSHGLHERSKRIEECKGEQEESNSFTILLRRRNSRTGFYNTLNLKRLGSFHKIEHWMNSMRLNKEELARGLRMSHKVDSTAHVGNKVLPICDTTVSPSSTSNDQVETLDKKDRPKEDKTRTMSRMKELLRWAAAAKSGKGGKYLGQKVMNFRNRGTLKAAPQDDQLSLDSPKISFRWDVGSCSSTSSVYSTISLASSAKMDPTWNKPSVNSIAGGVSVSDHDNKELSVACQDKDRCSSRTGNWITTDAEFVVLEL